MALRVALALVRCLAPIVPSGRRDTWRAQWRADLWHYTGWLHDQPHLSPLARAIALAGRTTGAVPHACLLRIDEWSLRMLGQDVKYAWRRIVRRPAFTAVAVVILGLGIGANATIFSWIESILLRPIPGVDAGPLVELHGTTASRQDLSFSYPNYVDLRAMDLDGIEGVMAFRAVAINMAAGGEPRRIWGQLVTPNFFDLLRVEPLLGRGFIDADAPGVGSTPVAVLSHHAWTHHFAADPAIVGRTVTLNAHPYTIVGIGPSGFRGTVTGLALDVFVPITMQARFMSGDRLRQRGSNFLQVFARVAPEASLAQAQASLDVAAARLAEGHSENDGRGILAKPLWRVGAAGLLLPVMSVLVAVVGVVLLIACANLAGLLLARASGRQREVAVRIALGSSRGRLVRQFLLECTLLALGGGVAGLAMAAWTSGLLMTLMPPTPFPVAFEAGIGGRVMLFAVLLTGVTVFGFGLLPALKASRPDVQTTLKDGSAQAGAARARIRSALVVAQVALSLLLLVCAALFARGLAHARTIEPGFSLRDGAIAALDLLPNGYDAPRGMSFHQQLLDVIAGVPGVASATVASAMPLDISRGSDMAIDVDGYVPALNEAVQAYYNRVGPRYFETMGVRIVSGRALDARDTAERPSAVVINETMARRYWPGQDPLGRIIRYGSGPAMVVGVAADGKYGSLDEAPRNYVYVSLAQSFRHDVLLIVRTSGDPGPVMLALPAAVKQLDPQLPLFDVRTVQEHLQVSLFIPSLARTVLAAFGGLALLLSTVGLYSVVATAASQRTREIGVRVALGATPADILRLVVRQGMALTVIGLGIGLLLSALAARALASQLMGVDPMDVASFAVTALVLGVVALAACLIPAGRAARLDPVRALRVD